MRQPFGDLGARFRQGLLDVRRIAPARASDEEQGAKERGKSYSRSQLYDFPASQLPPVEIFVYCLRGPVAVRLDDATVLLETDESMTIAPGVTGAWGPAQPVGGQDLPPLLLYVNAKRDLTIV